VNWHTAFLFSSLLIFASHYPSLYTSAQCIEVKPYEESAIINLAFSSLWPLLCSIYYPQTIWSYLFFLPLLLISAYSIRAEHHEFSILPQRDRLQDLSNPEDLEKRDIQRKSSKKNSIRRSQLCSRYQTRFCSQTLAINIKIVRPQHPDRNSRAEKDLATEQPVKESQPRYQQQRLCYNRHFQDGTQVFENCVYGLSHRT